MPILAKAEVFIMDARGWHTSRSECSLEMLDHPNDTPRVHLNTNKRYVHPKT